MLTYFLTWYFNAQHFLFDILLPCDILIIGHVWMCRVMQAKIESSELNSKVRRGILRGHMHISPTFSRSFVKRL